MEEFGEIGTAGCSHDLPDSKISETSYFQSQMHLLSTADSYLEDGELQKMLTSTLYAQKASGNPMSCRRERGKCTVTQADRNKSFRSHSSEIQKALGKPNALFSSEQGNLIRSSVFRNANPSNLGGSLLEGNKDHLLKQARSKEELPVESLNMHR